MATFGECFKELRIKAGYTLRSFCREFKFDASNISKLERGVNPPPKASARLHVLLAALGVKEGSDDYKTLTVLAEKAQGNFSFKGLSNDEIIKKLPVFLRREDGSPLSERELDNMIEKIREAWTSDKEWASGKE